MTPINVNQLQENFFSAVGDEWMLIAAGTPEKCNFMTASWGCMGILWGRPVAICFVRPERYTYEFIEKNDVYTLSFLGDSEAMRKAYEICGSQSGRDINKLEVTGLKAISTQQGSVAFEQSRLTLECRKLFVTDMKEANFLDKSILKQFYEGQGLHRIYVGEIVTAWK